MTKTTFDNKFDAEFSIIPSLQHPALEIATNSGLQIRHGFFTAKGGVSAGVYKSLNCGFGSQDDRVLITENRRRVAASLGFKTDRMFGLRQTHSPDCVFIDAGSTAVPPVADALVTGTANHAISILTADCVPVLLAAPSAGLVGAAHAGWRGAVSGILAATVSMMIDKGAAYQQIEAVIGPAIQQKNYEVGEDLRSRVLYPYPDAEVLFVPHEKGKYLFDLPGFVEMLLRAAGIHRVHNLNIDTYGESSGLFSHRQAMHAALPDSGRQISVIGILSEADS
jgi:YfiH family protein